MNFTYDKDSTNEAILASQNALTSLESIPNDMNKASSLASGVQVTGLDFLNDLSYSEIINVSSNYPAIIIGMMNAAEKEMIINCIQKGDMSRLVQYVNDGKINTQTLIEYSKEYMVDIMNSGAANTYNIGFGVIGGERSKYQSVNSALKALGFNDKFINNLSNEYCKNLINNNLMYTKEGSVTMATSFIGLLSMFNLKLGYKHVEFDRSYDGFYFGTGVTGSSTLGAIDCCNFTDWLARCVGIDIYAHSALDKYKYADDGITPKSEILASYNSEYYKKGGGGDYLSNDNHIMMIVGNDGKGYFYAENGGYAQIKYLTYEQLANKGYKVTNTDALYRNTATPNSQEYVWYNEDGTLASSYSKSGMKIKSQIFALPAWFINQNNINLTPTEQKKLMEQYKKRNKNSSFTGIDLSFGIKDTNTSINGTNPNATGITTEIIKYVTGGETQGPQAVETWYPLPMETVVNNMEKKYGYTDLVYKIRNDGVRILSGTAPDGTKFKDLVMVAADVREPIANPNGTFERGQIVETKVGKGIVVDFCKLAMEKRKNNQGVHFDIAGAWHEEPYRSQVYDENNNPRIPNVPSTPSTQVQPNIPSTPDTHVQPNIPSTPGTQIQPSIPSTPDTQIQPSIPSTPSTPSINISNILPDNKFSNYMPELTSGRLRGMEISQNSVSYEVLDVSNDVYNNYITSLLEKGYVLSSDGTYTNGTYKIIANLTEEGVMNIDLGLII